MWTLSHSLSLHVHSGFCQAAGCGLLCPVIHATSQGAPPGCLASKRCVECVLALTWKSWGLMEFILEGQQELSCKLVLFFLPLVGIAFKSLLFCHVKFHVLKFVCYPTKRFSLPRCFLLGFLLLLLLFVFVFFCMYVWWLLILCNGFRNCCPHHFFIVFIIGCFSFTTDVWVSMHVVPCLLAGAILPPQLLALVLLLWPCYLISSCCSVTDLWASFWP